MTGKKCTKCDVTKDVDADFYPRKTSAGTKVAMSWCKSCCSENNNDRQKKARQALRMMEAQSRD